MDQKEAKEKIDHGKWWNTEDPESVLRDVVDRGYTYVTECDEHLAGNWNRHTWYLSVTDEDRAKLIECAPKFTKVEFEYEVQRTVEDDQVGDGDNENRHDWS
jgi:hypothetical protein